MTGFYLVQRIRRLEAECDNLGLMMCSSRFGARGGITSSRGSNSTDVVGVVPKDHESLPIFSRDAELFVGTLDALESWIEGVKWARNYDRMLFGKNNDAKRRRKEQDYRNQQLVNILVTKEEKAVIDGK